MGTKARLAIKYSKAAPTMLCCKYPKPLQGSCHGDVEKLWREFFSDPSQWWDHRSEKANVRYPDFKHRKTQKALWLNHKCKPNWVELELAALPPGTLQASTFSWNVRLVRYVKTGQPAKTMELFQRMQQEGMVPDKFTFVPVLNACASLQALEEGRRVHLQIMERGFDSIPYVSNSLIDMYAKCGNIEDAWKVFDKMLTHDVVSWNSIISRHVKCRQAKKALELFQQMQQEGLDADRVTFLAVLNACAIEMAVEEGRQVHNHIIRSGYESDVFVGSSLVDMYAKCGSIGDAQRVFHKMPMHNVVSWSALIWGHVKCRQEQKALELYRQMQVECVKPEPVTFFGVLNACASAGWLEEGRCIHEHIIKRGYESDLFVGSSLVDMYAKCGSIKDAQHVFNKMSTRNAVTWNAMLAGYAIHGHAKEAFEHFERMCEEGVEMGLVTFVSLLSTCSHAGLVDEGLVYFDSMSLVHHVSPTVEHYACMVDLFGRAGHLHEAEELIKTTSCEPNAPVWKALLGACRVYGDVEMENVLQNKFSDWTLEILQAK